MQKLKRAFWGTLVVLVLLWLVAEPQPFGSGPFFPLRERMVQLGGVLAIGALGKLAADARSADVRLHVLIDARDGRLTGGRIREAVPQWREASIWFCGPAAFGEALRRDFRAHGFPVGLRFHQELFAMR